MPNNQLNAAEAAARLAEVRQSMAQAAAKAGRDISEIRLLAVSKTFSAELIKIYLGAGQLSFGENYIKEAREKIPALADFSPAADWHFIGHLQTNKAKYAVQLFNTIHSVDSLDLAAELDRRAEALAKRLDIYIQVNVALEDSKSGLTCEELPAFLESLTPFKSLNPVGLMTMPPYDPDPEESRPYFAALRQLRDRWAPQLKELSMGMSGDYGVAIEEGATIVRIGTALFGSR